MNENLYNDPILHWAGRNEYIGSLDHPDRQAIQSNPLCGDRVTLQIEMADNRIKGLWYQVRGCILCKASCAHMASLVQGLNEDRLKTFRDGFENFLKRPSDQTAANSDYSVFAAVRPHKSRHRCVLLPYETALKAISHRFID